MKRQRQLAVTLIGTLAAQTIGALAPGHGVSLPSPRAYVATYTLWGILGLVAEVGDAAAAWSARLSMLVMLTSMVLGPFGRKTSGWLNLIGTNFATPPATSTGTESPGGRVI